MLVKVKRPSGVVMAVRAGGVVRVRVMRAAAMESPSRSVMVPERVAVRDWARALSVPARRTRRGSVLRRRGEWVTGIILVGCMDRRVGVGMVAVDRKATAVAHSRDTPPYAMMPQRMGTQFQDGAPGFVVLGLR